MRAIVCDGKGGFLEVELEKPSPTGWDILVRNSAVSVNPVDTKVVTSGRDLGGTPTTSGDILGFDSCGVVEAVGDKASLFKPGDRVFYAGSVLRPGSNSEYTLVDERIVALAPKSLTDVQAAAVPLVGLTAFEALTEKLGISSPASIGKKILVLPGAGGVGPIAIQLAKRVFNMEVIATSSRPDTAGFCKEMGADHVISHREPLRPQLESLGIPFVDYVLNGFDTAANFEQYCDIVRPMGGIVSLVETEQGLPMGKLFFKRISFHWELMFQRSANGDSADLIAQHKILSQLAYLFDSGVLCSTVKAELKMDLQGLAEAHQIQLSGKAVGKTVLRW